MIQAAVFGYGNIGSGVVTVLEENKEQIARVIPGGLHVKYILDIRDFPDSPYQDRIVHDINTILSDPEVKVVCETMGGKEPAFTFSKRALECGISVCSSNKELVEAHGPELLSIARAHGCSYLFEASVGGGIPLIAPLINCLAQEEIQSVTGILNGTTNYILTKMERYGAEYDVVLKEAQELGYAERNPEADVEGHDTGRKISILSSLACGRTVRYDDIHTEGITKITPADFSFAKNYGYSIKLLGMSRIKTAPDASRQVEIMTAPFLVPQEHPLYSVSDVFNGVLIHGNMVDDIMLYGRGAGKLPTGSAVVSDMILAAKNAGSTVQINWDPEVIAPVSPDHYVTSFYVRAQRSHKEQLQTLFAGLLENEWTLPNDSDDSAEYAFVTRAVPESDFFAAADKADGIRNIIRILA